MLVYFVNRTHYTVDVEIKNLFPIFAEAGNALIHIHICPSVSMMNDNAHVHNVKGEQTGSSIPALTVTALTNCSLQLLLPTTRARLVFLMSLSTVLYTHTHTNSCSHILRTVADWLSVSVAQFNASTLLGIIFVGENIYSHIIYLLNCYIKLISHPQ